ncbi:hypothetical protein JCM8547_004713 [Rhodosporidiobolus lusitaniae]
MESSRASSVSSKATKVTDERKKADGTTVSQEPLGALEENRLGEVEAEQIDGVFGAGGEGKVDYRSVSWLSTSVLMTKAQIGLGVLSIPSVFHTLGLVPGLLILLFVAGLTTYTDWYISGPWKRKHPQCYSVSDAGYIMWGPIGREICGAGYWLFLVFVVGAALVGLSTALNAISLHATCTAVFVVVAAVATYPFASLRTLGSVRWIGWVGLASMVVSIMLVTIAVGAGGRPSPAPQEGPWDKGIVYFGNPSFADAMNAIANLLLSYAGTSTYLPMVSEMKNPRESTKAVLLSQAFITAFYLVVGIVVYMYAGQYVASPALGTAGVLIKRVAYGLALPGLLAAAVIYCHLPAKWIFVRSLRGSRHLTEPTWQHWAAWLGCTFGCLAFAYIIASAVPVFSGLVGLIGAFFGTLLALQIVSCMWFFDNWHRRHERNTLGFKLMVAFNVMVILVGSFIMVAGTYGAVVSIIDEYNAGTSGAWSCADNSGST